MLNLTEPYAPFSTPRFWAFAIRGTLKANTHFSTTTFEAFALRACQDIPHHTCPHNTQKARDQISLALIHLIPLVDYNIKVLSINQKLIKIWKKKHYSN